MLSKNGRINMKFVDTIGEVKNHCFCDFLKKRKVMKAYDQLIAQHVDTVDLICNVC